MVNTSSILPKVSFVIPTLNEKLRLPICLDSVVTQNYPRELIEIIVVDGGSEDNTTTIAKKYNAHVFENKYKTSESGKAVGINKANGEYLVLIDADNILPDKNWLRKMVQPLLNDPSLIGSEPIRYTYREEDGFIDRYCALMGMNDPLCFWLGSYDRYNTISEKWTGLSVPEKQRDGYLEVTLARGNIPTIGANGTMFRTKVLLEDSSLFTDYFFDMDVLEHITRKLGPQKFAKVDVGIIHVYCGSDLRKFWKKQLRRVKDYLYRRTALDVLLSRNTSERVYTYGHTSGTAFFKRIIVFGLSCIFFIPLLIQAAKGYKRKKDVAWFAHPLLSWITLLVYTRGFIGSIFRRRELSRENWGKE